MTGEQTTGQSAYVRVDYPAPVVNGDGQMAAAPTNYDNHPQGGDQTNQFNQRALDDIRGSSGTEVIAIQGDPPRFLTGPNHDAIDSLAKAHSTCQFAGFEAARSDYQQSVREADKIDQNALKQTQIQTAAQLAELNQRIADSLRKGEELQPGGAQDTMRQILQGRQDRQYELYMSPATTRINMGMAEIRTRDPQHIAEGISSIRQGIALRPEALDDRNFQRHLKLACDAAGIAVPDVRPQAADYAAVGLKPPDSEKRRRDQIEQWISPPKSDPTQVTVPRPGNPPANPQIRPRPENVTPLNPNVAPTENVPPNNPAVVQRRNESTSPGGSGSPPASDRTGGSGGEGAQQERHGRLTLAELLLGGAGALAAYRLWRSRHSPIARTTREIESDGINFEQDAPPVKATEGIDEKGDHVWLVTGPDGKVTKFSDADFNKRFKESATKGEFLDREKQPVKALQSEIAQTINDGKGHDFNVKPGDWLVLKGDQLSVVKDKDFVERFRPAVEPNTVFLQGNDLVSVLRSDRDTVVRLDKGEPDGAAAAKLTVNASDFKQKFEPIKVDAGKGMETLYTVKSPDTSRPGFTTPEPTDRLFRIVETKDGVVQMEQVPALRIADPSSLVNAARTLPAFEDTANGAIRRDAQGRVIESCSNDGTVMLYDWASTKPDAPLVRASVDGVSYERIGDNKWTVDDGNGNGKPRAISADVVVANDGAFVVKYANGKEVRQTMDGKVATTFVPAAIGKDADGKLTDVKYSDGMRLQFDWEGTGDKAKITRITDNAGAVYERAADGTFKMGKGKVDCVLSPDGTFVLTRLPEGQSASPPINNDGGTNKPAAVVDKPAVVVVPIDPKPAPAVDAVDPKAAPAVDAVDPKAVPAVDAVDPKAAPAMDAVDPKAAKAADAVDPKSVPVVDAVDPKPAPAVDAVDPKAAPAADAVDPKAATAADVVAKPAAVEAAQAPLTVQINGRSFEAVGTGAGGIVIKHPGVFHNVEGSFNTNSQFVAEKCDKFTLNVDGQEKTVYRFKKGLPQLFEVTETSPNGSLRLRVMEDYELVHATDIQSVGSPGTAKPDHAAKPADPAKTAIDATPPNDPAYDFRDNVTEQPNLDKTAAPSDVVASAGDFGKSTAGGEVLTTGKPGLEGGVRPGEESRLTPEEIAKLQKQITDDPTIDPDLKRRAVSALELARDPANLEARSAVTDAARSRGDAEGRIGKAEGAATGLAMIALALGSWYMVYKSTHTDKAKYHSAPVS